MPVIKSMYDDYDYPKVFQYTLSSPNGSLVVKVINHGAIITNILVKTKNSNFVDVVLGFDSYEGYKSPLNPYFGAVVGRIANRIKDGTFKLNNQIYNLDKNEKNLNHLHGGKDGFSHRFWEEVNVTDKSVSLKLFSPDDDQGYPVALEVIVTYTVTADDELLIKYEAQLVGEESLSTIVNLTNHSYFNLSGFVNNEDNKNDSTICDHELQMSKDVLGVLEIDAFLIPTGDIKGLNSSDAKHFNFQKKKLVGQDIDAIPGYDHCYVTSNPIGKDKKLGENFLVTIRSPKTGITMMYDTDALGFQMYTGEFISSKLKSKQTQNCGLSDLGPRSGICFESQSLPDAINHEEWKDQVILNPGEKYEQNSIYKFTCE